MKKFRSRLDRIQRMHEQQEQLARTRLAACRQAEQDARHQQQNIRSQLIRISESACHLLRQRSGSELLAGTLAMYRRCQDQLDSAEQAVRSAQAAAEQALEAWHTARSERKAIDLRMDRLRTEHRRTQLIQEEHCFQETASQVHFQRTAESGQGSTS